MSAAAIFGLSVSPPGAPAGAHPSRTVMPADAGGGQPADGPHDATPSPPVPADPAPLLRGVLQRPVSLDVAPDGRVYLSDPGPGVVQVMQPWGEFMTPIGLTGVEDARLETPRHLAIGRDPASGQHRLYVQDTGAKAVVVFDLDGNFIAAWPKIKGAGIAVAPDGRVFAADTTDYTIRVFRPDGTELFRFGEKGEEAGQFTSFTGIGISPAGDVLAVGDLKGKRVQLFNLPADPASDDVRLRRPPYNLELGRYTSGDFTCRATTVNSLGGDDVWIGEGNGACVVTPRSAEFPIASATFDSLICKPTVRLPRIRRSTGQFYALAAYDPNLGPCGGKQTVLATAPVILRYMDIDLKRVHTLWPVPGSAVIVRAADDTTVRNTDPDKGFGNDDELQVRLAPEQVLRSFLKFEVEDSDLAIGQRESVRLHLFANNGSDDAGALYAVPAIYPTTTPETTPTPWTEDNLTWNRAPPLDGTPLASGGNVADNQWVAFDVATAVPGDGVYAFGLANASANRADYNSREADGAVPLLVLGMRIAAAPSPTNVVWPTGVATPTPTETPTEAPTATVTSAPTFTPSPTFEPGMGDRFSPIHDTRVLSTSPDKSYGTSTQLRARTGLTTTIAYTYLKFEVAGIMEPDRVMSATLRLYAYDGGVDLSAYRVSNDIKDGSVAWFESDLTWNNAPPMTGEPLGATAPVTTDAYVELDVTRAIGADGEYSFAVKTSAENNIALYSKEAPDRRPELVLRYTRPPLISPTPSSTPTPSLTPTVTDTPAPTVATPTPTTKPPPVSWIYLPYSHRPRR